MVAGLILYRMLKKSFHGLFQLKKTKMRFCLSSIFNDVQSLKMAAHPCAAFRLPKNGVFQQPVKVGVVVLRNMRRIRFLLSSRVGYSPLSHGYQSQQARHSEHGWMLEGPSAAGRPPSSLRRTGMYKCRERQDTGSDQGGIHGVSLMT
ncbi:hypothetical protein TBH_C1972 [Thiolapillus brandeum]|uniref:Uncharacterized protein n=1 Tax=Thiolapillus brandeum TaxID=1076588 RepID=A0A7U6JII1_9GAMM|nr:hypothetical protein TBH_C1972 [Thiolapillus brandeum]